MAWAILHLSIWLLDSPSCSLVLGTKGLGRTYSIVQRPAILRVQKDVMGEEGRHQLVSWEVLQTARSHRKCEKKGAEEPLYGT